MSTRITLLLSILLTLSACGALTPSPPAPAEEEVAEPFFTHEWLVADDEFRCFPVDEDVFDHPIDDLPLPIAPGENIWPRIQAGLSLPLVEHKSVQQQMDWYLSHPNYLARVQNRASRYLFYIIEHLHEQNVPYDIALLPIVESAYEPFAYSHGQASGLWQFIPGTGKRFRLDQNWWYDGRRDVVQSTDAAIQYLSYLHDFFDGDWLLAIAAYNSGEGTVRNAVKKNLARGKPTDFWHLDLPEETSAYVPKMIALAELFRNPEKYGLELLPISNEPYFVSVELDSQIDLAQAAKLADITIEEIYYLNSGLNRWATPPKDHYELKIPVSQYSLFVDALAKLPDDQRVTWQRYRVKSGDSLSAITNKFNSDKALICDVNNLHKDQIYAGQTLLIPAASATNKTYLYSQNQRLIKKQNSKPSSANYKQVYRVQPGDSFWKISRQHNVDVSALAKWNNKSPKDTLKVGEKLVIWKHIGSTHTAPGREPKITKVNYKVRKGDSLAKVASKFKVKISQIVDWNNINPQSYLQPGQALTLFVNVMETY